MCDSVTDVGVFLGPDGKYLAYCNEILVKQAEAISTYERWTTCQGLLSVIIDEYLELGLDLELITNFEHLAGGTGVKV